MDPDQLKQIRERIEQVHDPDLGVPLGALNALHDVQFRDGQLELYIELIPPLQWVAQPLDRACREALAELVADTPVQLYVRERPISRATPSSILPGVKYLLAIASGKGGVGKSTIAANIAVTLARAGTTVGLLDADIYGPSAPTLFGLQGMPLHARKDEQGRVLGIPHERYGVRIVSMGFVLQREQAAILRGPLLAGYFTTLVEQVEWGELDFLVFDLPPGTGDIQLTMAQKVPLTGVVLITTPQELALADVRRSATMFRRVNVPILGIVENMSYFTCPHCGHREPIFGEGGGRQLAEELGIPFLGQLPLDPLLQRASDEGIPAVEHPAGTHFRHLFADIVRELVREIRRHCYRTQAPPLEISL